jgi:hypothetical protein
MAAVPPVTTGGVCGRDSGSGTFAGVLGRKADLWGGGGGDGAGVLGAVTAGVSDREWGTSLLVAGGGTDVGWGCVGVTVGGLACRRTSLRLGRGGGTACLTGGCAADPTEGWLGGGGSRLFSVGARGGGGGGVGAGEDETEAACGGCGDDFFALSLSPSLQLAALSPRALAIFHSPLRLGGTGGFSPFVAAGAIVGGGAMLGISSSQTFSTIPVRTNAHSVHVVRRRARHHPLVHSG